MHYARWQAHGDPLKTLRRRNNGELCLVDGCELLAKTKGYCRSHYNRYWLTGDPGSAAFKISKRPVVDGQKECGTCGTWKPLIEFNYHPNGSGGVGSSCRLCLAHKSRAWFAANPEYRATWSEANAEIRLADVHKRRATRLGVDAEFINRREVFERDDFTCLLCGDPLDMSKKTPHPLAPTIDHVTPISLGGSHVLANIQSAHFHCNISKGNRDKPLTRPLTEGV